MTHIVTHKRRVEGGGDRLNTLARIQAVLAAANSLMRDNYTIVAFLADAMCARPEIWIEHEARLARLVDLDVAVYNCLGFDALGSYRIGQFERMGVYVRWIEREWRH